MAITQPVGIGSPSASTNVEDTKPIIKAEEFFRINSTIKVDEDKAIIPSTPYVEIQFRASMSSETEGTSLSSENSIETNEWVTVSTRIPSSTYTPPVDQNISKSSLKFDNYFENLELEDSGGVVKCNLSLYDKDLERLENIIIKSVISTKGGNDIVKRKIDEVPPKAILEFMPNPSSNINFRLRFGYSEASESERIFRPALMSNKDWKERTKEKNKDVIYLKSPWMYFMMMGLTFDLTNKGVVAKINGMSMSNTYLDKTKIIKRFALMQGTPQKLLKNISEQVYISTGGRVQVVKAVEPGRVSTTKAEPLTPDGIPAIGKDIDYGEPSDLPIQWAVEPKEGEDTVPEGMTEEQRREAEEDLKILKINISLGGEPNLERDEEGRLTGKMINEYMSLRDLIRDFVNKVPPILRNRNTDEYITDAERIKEIMENKDGNEDPTIFEQIPYTFSINEQTRAENSNADTDTIVVIRFFYRRIDKAKQCFVRSYDYRQAPNTIITSFSVRNKFDFIQLNQNIIVKGNELDVMLSSPPPEIDNNAGGIPSNVTDYFQKQLQSDDFTLVNKIVENNGGDNSNSIAAQVVKNMNEGIFFGDIEILGDPFYLFDPFVQPYQYFILLNVYRNYNEYSRNNNKILNKSYLSGYYLIKKIKHVLSSSGFKTTLSIEKYPSTNDSLLKRCQN
jgi:hypothetical protein